MDENIKKSHLYHTRGITPERVSVQRYHAEACETYHLGGFAPGQHSFEGRPQQLRAVGVGEFKMTNMTLLSLLKFKLREQ